MAATLSAERQPMRNRVLGIIIDALRSGTYKEGDRLPSERDLATEIGVSRAIVGFAIDELAQRGSWSHGEAGAVGHSSCRCPTCRASASGPPATVAT